MVERGYSSLREPHQLAVRNCIEAVNKAVNQAVHTKSPILIAILRAWASTSLNNVQQKGPEAKVLLTVSHLTYLENVIIEPSNTVEIADSYVKDAQLRNTKAVGSFIEGSRLEESTVIKSVVTEKSLVIRGNVQNSSINKSVVNRSTIGNTTVINRAAITDSFASESHVEGPSTCISASSRVIESVVNPGSTLIHTIVQGSTITRNREGQPPIFVNRKLDKIDR